MRKSSVYLPDEMKAGLAALSARWDRSEAELIRLAIDRLVATAEHDAAPARAVEVPTGPCLLGVGIGPSDPDLVTERALVAIRSADRVCAASTGADVISRAEAVVRAVAPEVTVDRLVVDIGDEADARARSIADGADQLVAHLDRGLLVALVVLGDPNVYSVFSRLASLVRAQRPTVPIASVPGIMGFQELAARTGTVLVEGDEQLSILSLDDEVGPIEPLLDDADRTVVIYKGGRHVPAVARLLDDHARGDGAVLGEMLGLPGGRSVDVASVADRPASYLATVVIPARRASEGQEPSS
ncbi:MAG TPA: SAM-dependent methyltransferase [Acidimicrobiia bacterium]|nr:SAM-dependent methyltransferase [Acidimicrobiia bacterium]